MMIICPRCLKSEDDYNLRGTVKSKTWDSELVMVVCQTCDYPFMVRCERIFQPCESITPLQFLKAHSISIPAHISKDGLYFLMEEAFDAMLASKEIPDPTTIPNCAMFGDTHRFYEVCVLPLLQEKYRLQTT